MPVKVFHAFQIFLKQRRMTKDEGKRENRTLCAPILQLQKEGFVATMGVQSFVI